MHRMPKISVCRYFAPREIDFLRVLHESFAKPSSACARVVSTALCSKKEKSE